MRIPLLSAALVAATALSLVSIPAAAQIVRGPGRQSGEHHRGSDSPHPGRQARSERPVGPSVRHRYEQGWRNNACGAEMKGCSQKADGPLQMTPLAAEWTKNFDPAKYDATGHCNPMGYTRSMNAPVATEIVQTPKELVFLHESMFAFHVVYLDGRPHPTPDEAQGDVLVRAFGWSLGGRHDGSGYCRSVLRHAANAARYGAAIR